MVSYTNDHIARSQKADIRTINVEEPQEKLLKYKLRIVSRKYIPKYLSA